MAKIIPFKGLRPRTDLASQVATLPYDVCSTEEARQYKDQPYHFYHVTRSEIDLPEDTDPHAPVVYEKAAENLRKMISDGILIQDEAPCYYIYRLIMDGRSQTGLVCGSAIEDYEKGVIKKHEFTRPEKELDRINHIRTTNAQTGVVFLTYPNVLPIDDLIDSWKNEHEPVYDFVAEDGVQHTVWVVNDFDQVALITDYFDTKVPATYIADGHHRAASAAKVAASNEGAQEENAAADYFLTCLFPANQLSILDYNRVVTDLNGLTPAEFLSALEADFKVTQVGANPHRPDMPGVFGLYLAGNWYRLEVKDEAAATDIIDGLDVSMLQNLVLSKILGIHDPRVDSRVSFIGGIRGLDELKRRVDSGEFAAAFACFPLSLDTLIQVADSGRVMPPKSTWFEPKTRDGLLIYLI